MNVRRWWYLTQEFWEHKKPEHQHTLFGRIGTPVNHRRVEWTRRSMLKSEDLFSIIVDIDVCASGAIGPVNRAYKQRFINCSQCVYTTMPGLAWQCSTRCRIFFWLLHWAIGCGFLSAAGWCQNVTQFVIGESKEGSLFFQDGDTRNKIILKTVLKQKKNENNFDCVDRNC